MVSLFPPILWDLLCADDLCVSVSFDVELTPTAHSPEIPRCPFSEKTADDPCVTRCGHLFCWNHLLEVCGSRTGTVWMLICVSSIPSTSPHPTPHLRHVRHVRPRLEWTGMSFKSLGDPRSFPSTPLGPRARVRVLPHVLSDPCPAATPPVSI